MEELHRECIRRHHVVIVQNLEPRDIIDFLYQEHTIEDDECESINCHLERIERCRKLLGVLQRKPNCFQSFIEALSQRYKYLADALLHTFSSLQAEGAVGRSCFQTHSNGSQSPPSPPVVSVHPQNDVTPPPPSYSMLFRQNTVTEQPANTSPPLSINSSPTTVSEKPLYPAQANTNMADPHETQVKTVLTGNTVRKFPVNASAAVGTTSTAQTSSGQHADNSVHVPLIRTDISPTHMPQVSSNLTLQSYANGSTSFMRQLPKIAETYEMSNCSNLDNVTPPVNYINNVTFSQNGRSSVWNPKMAIEEIENNIYNYDADVENNDGASEWENLSDSSDDSSDELNSNDELLYLDKMPPANFGRRKSRRMTFLFDNLSTAINSGKHEDFLSHYKLLWNSCGSDMDYRFMLLYLRASSYLWQNDYNQCKKFVKKALRTTEKTTQPSRCLVEILSSQCWMYFQQGKLNLLQRSLDQALQTIAMDPVNCSGMAAGWIYVDQARIISSLMNSTDYDRFYNLRQRAITCLELALQHFKLDETKDGPFGTGFSAIMLASMLLACGDKLQSVWFKPSDEDIQRAHQLIQSVEEAGTGVPAVLQVEVYLVKADYKFRTGSYQQAYDCAELAKSWATQLKMPEHIAPAQMRMQALLQRPRSNSRDAKDETKLNVFDSGSSAAEVVQKNKTQSVNKHRTFSLYYGDSVRKIPICDMRPLFCMFALFVAICGYLCISCMTA